MSKKIIEDIYTLSPLQEGLLFHSVYSTESDAYLQQLRFSIRGKLDVRAFEQAWHQVIARHTILRTAFIWDRYEKLLQVVHRQVKLPWLELDCRELSAAAQQEELAALLKEDRRRGFDISQAPLLRMTVVRFADESYELFCTLHHLLTDGWSTANLIKELFAFYNASCEGRELNLERPRPYRHYIEWLQHQDSVEAELFWRDLLKGFTAPTPLIGKTRQVDRSDPDESIEIQKAWLSRETTASLQSWARQLGITMNTVLLGAWAILLSRYSNEKDIVFGVTVAGRPASLAGVEAMVGPFINTLPIRVQLPPDTRLRPWLGSLQTRLLEICEYAYSPLTQVQRFSDVSRGVPLFESMLVFENYPLDVPAQSLSRHLESVSIHSIERSNFPLGLVAAPGPKLYLQIGYDSRRFSFDTISRMLGHLEAVLESMLANPDQRLCELSLLTSAEQQQLLVSWNSTANQVAQENCLHQLFEEQVALTPESIAVICEDRQLTYRQLNNRANQLAHYLRDQHIGPEVQVGICIERSLEMIVGILGILKAGAAYVPVAPDQPPERLRYILDDAHIRLLLTQQSLLERISSEGIQVVRLDADWELISGYRAENPLTEVAADNTAYVIYTSGSTGQPKGVMVPHGGICNTLLWRRHAFSLNGSDRILQNLSFAFDASVWQIFGALLNGAQLILAPPGSHRDTAYLAQAMIEYGITITDFPPSMLQVLLNETGIERCRSLRHLFCGGEAMRSELQEQFFAKLDAELHNIYGPTETAVDATCWTCQPKENGQIIPIGRPINNKQIYLLDSQLQPVPVGVEGEICISGSGLARGYLGRPHATSEKFIPHPFSTEPGARLYRTGDIARFLPDGNIEFLGRNDRQVKIRGYRMELGEVEAALSEHPQVAQAVAVAREEIPGEQRLVAYVVSRPGSALTSRELSRYLQERLPPYMVPSAFVHLEELPLTTNGKVDSRALPAPEFQSDEIDYVSPRTQVEETLCGIWAKVLRVKQVGINDNFFELGGDSILSIQVSALARQTGLHLTPGQLFQHPTIATLAEVTGQGTRIRAEQGLVVGSAPLTPIQHEFFEWGLANPHHYYQAMQLDLAPEVDSLLLERAVAELLKHHDVLRLRFKRAGKIWSQVYADPVNESLFSRRDLSAIAAADRKVVLEEDAGRISATLNLEKGPLFRTVEYEFGAGEKKRLLIVIHHLIMDGVSWRILLEDLQSAYKQLHQGGPVRLPAKTSSFKVWAERLNQYAESPELVQEASYWTSAERATVRGVPLDYELGQNNMGSAQTISVNLTAAETGDLLYEVPAVYHTQINDLLLTALAQVFQRWTGERSLLVTLEGHGREDIFEDIDLSRTVGWFTTVFPVLLQVEESGHPGRALQAVKEQLRRIPQRGLGYGLLRFMNGDPNIAEQLRSLPLAEISFNYLGQFDQLFSESEQFAFARQSTESRESEGPRKHVLDVTSMVFDGCLQINWSYSENLHKRETIEELSKWYVQFIRELIAHCKSPEAGGYTPSDFPLANVDQQTLNDQFGHRRDVGDLYPLSPMQEGLLFHYLYAPQSNIYFLQASCRISAALDVMAFQRAWQTIVDRHAILRTSFLWEGLSQPLQVVNENINLEWSEEAWPELSRAEQRARWDELLRRDRECAFDLSRAPLMRLTLVRSGTDDYYFAWSTHHILLDGWSSQFVMQEVLAVYEAYSRGAELQLKQLHKYREYIGWLQRQDLNKAKAFWREELKGFTEPTILGIDRRTNGPSEEEAYEEQSVSLSEELTSRLESLTRASRITLNTVLQGAWGLLLSRYSGRDDVVFGATSSGRSVGPTGIETMVGLFINTLPVRVHVKSEESVKTYLKELHGRQSKAQDYEYSPLAQVQGWSDVARGTTVFENILVFENFPIDASIRKSQRALQIAEGQGFERTHYPLTLTAMPGTQLQLRVEYDCRRFDGESMTRLLDHLQRLLEGMAREPDRRVCDLPLLSETEREQILTQWNRTETKYSREKLLHELFEEQAERTPEAVAVVYERESLSYEDLNQRANELAHYLRKQGVGPEVRVGLCVKRSPEMVVGLLGLLKAGGAFVPLDPDYPSERLAYMLEDAQVKVLLTQEKLKTNLPKSPALVVCVDSDWNIIARELKSNPEIAATPENLAYVIYTSGSTGQPKGVMVQHSSVVSYVERGLQYSLVMEDIFLQFASISFDAAVEDIFACLTRGAQLVLRTDAMLSSARVFLQQCHDLQITVLSLPTAYWHYLTSALADEDLSLPVSVRLVIIGGERALPEMFTTWQQQQTTQNIELVNLYGPTETTISSTGCVLSELDRLVPASREVPIGRPVANTQVYVLDQHRQPVPVGIPGELHIGGECLARGYLNNPAVTSLKFIPHPFSSRPGDRLYKTGDLVRFLPDGNLEFVGRTDHQVKLRGFRIELGEIEAMLEAHPEVGTAIAVTHEDSQGEKRLVAYVVRRGGTAVTSAELRSYMQERVPPYMVPSVVMILEEMPLTVTGKIDRRAFPPPEDGRLESKSHFVAPRDFVEILLVRIWEKVLGIKRIGVKDDFFDLGGHSILALRLVGEIQKQFGRELPLAILFEKRTVERLAEVLTQQFETLPHSPLVPIQPLGTKRPLFFVHVGSGQVLCYLELARFLGTDQPFYGLQDVYSSEANDSESVREVAIEEMATYYIDSLRDIQPEGPYLLGGWSFGGVVAYEMARQLMERGEEVPLLILLDTVAPDFVRELRGVEDDVSLLAILAQEMGLPVTDSNLRSLEAEEQLRFVAEQMEKAHIIFDDSLAYVKRTLAILRARVNVMNNYHPKPYSGRIIFFSAGDMDVDADDKKRASALIEDPTRGFRKLSTGSLELYTIPDAHNKIARGESARIMAEMLRARINQQEKMVHSAV
jgi:amino acid adenylation domain-containing protein/non-ribosomal peptide synthase protein (TIGR01720 family)